MVAYRVKSVISNPITDFLSFYGVGTGLSLTETAASSVTIDAGQFLIASNSGDGLVVENGPWTVVINGAVVAFETDQGLANAGAAIRITNSNIAPFPVSNVYVNARADVYGGRWGILSEAPSNIVNASTIIAETNSAIAELADGTVSITNTGRIQANGTNTASDHTGSHALYFSGSGTHSIVNSGVIAGGNALGAFAIQSTNAGSNDYVTNSGYIFGDINLGGGADSFRMVKSGSVGGTIQLGDGNDIYSGGYGSETVADGGGSDTVTFYKGGIDVYLAATAALTGADGTDRIFGAGYSTYDASGAASDLKVNIDIYAHNNIVANSASGTDIGLDYISGFGQFKIKKGVYATYGFTTVKTGSGNDEVWGSKSTDYIYSGDGNDTVIGGAGNDVLDGEGGQDSLYGGEGNDTINGGNGDGDTVDGGNGHDTLNGGAGDDLVYGGAGNDFLLGGLGADTLQGELGDDSFDGGDGGDKLTGGSGKDLLTGGSGGDEFIYNFVSDSAPGYKTSDVINDFQTGDKIVLSAIDANAITATDEQFVWISAANFTRTAGELRFQFYYGDTYISGDVNGDAIVDFQIQLVGHHQVFAVDFVL